MAGRRADARERLPEAVANRGPNTYGRIKDDIMSGHLQPGFPVIEVQLAEHYGVSRTPVREALTRLEQDGLVVRGDRGLHVRESSPEEILDLYAVRIVLEATAARTAAERRTSNDLFLMSRVSQRAPSSLDDAEALSQFNHKFHRAVWSASHNQALVDLLERLNMHLGRYPATTLVYPGRWERALEQHGAIATAIEERDADRAADLATQHFTEAREIRLKLWQEEL